MRQRQPLGRLRVPEGAPGGADVWLTIRPERLTVCAADRDRGQTVEARVVSSAFLGTRTRAIVEVADVRLTVDVADEALADVGPGTLLTIGLPPDALWTVPREGTALPTSTPDGFVDAAPVVDAAVASPPDRRSRR